MNPIILIAAAGLAGFFLFGRKKKDDGAPALPPAPHSPPGAPIPPIPPILPDASVGPPPALGVSYAEQWASYPYTAYWYPAEADRTLIPPPSTWDGLSTNAGCTAIAVGEGWWERVGDFAQFMIDRGETKPRRIATAIMTHYAGSCRGAKSAAVAGMRAEVLERLESLLSGYSTVGYDVAKNGPRRNCPPGTSGGTFDFGRCESPVPLAPVGVELGPHRNGCGPSRYTLPIPGPPVGMLEGAHRNDPELGRSRAPLMLVHRNAVTQEPLELVLDPMKEVNVAAAWSRRRAGNNGNGVLSPNGSRHVQSWSTSSSDDDRASRPWRSRSFGLLGRSGRRVVIVR